MKHKLLTLTLLLLTTTATAQTEEALPNPLLETYPSICREYMKHSCEWHFMGAGIFDSELEKYRRLPYDARQCLPVFLRIKGLTNDRDFSKRCKILNRNSIRAQQILDMYRTNNYAHLVACPPDVQEKYKTIDCYHQPIKTLSLNCLAEMEEQVRREEEMWHKGKWRGWLEAVVVALITYFIVKMIMMREL